MNKLTAEKCRELISNLHRGRNLRLISTREERYLEALEIALPVLEQQENGGWIRWDGERALPPVEADALVEVRLRGYEVIKREAKYFAWRNGSGSRSYDIIAYRVIDQQERERGEEE